MFNNLKIGTRLFLLIGFMSVMLIAIGMVGIRGMGQTNDGLMTVYQDRVIPLAQLKAISDAYAVNVVDTTHKVEEGQLTWAEGRSNFDQATSTVAQQWGAYLGTVLTTEETQLKNRLVPLMDKADRTIDELKQLARQENMEGLEAFSASQLYQSIDPVTAVLDEQRAEAGV